MRAILDARVLVRGDEACALRGRDDKRLSRAQQQRKIDFFLFVSHAEQT